MQRPTRSGGRRTPPARRLAAALAGGLTMVAGGCDRAPDGPTGPGPAPSVRAADARRGPPPEVASRRLARLVAKFGGAFVDPAANTLTVYLTDLDDAPALARAIESNVRAHGRPELTVTVRRGRYAFSRLEGWRDALPLGWANGAVVAEVDERNNRVHVGVRDRAALASVRAAAARLGVPEDALSVDVAPAPRSAAALRDKIRPLRGGTQITTVGNQFGYGGFEITCTYGVTVLYNGAPHMVTNSHCTQRGAYGGLVNAAVFQSVRNNYHVFGNEVQDPPTFACVAGAACRYSDAALVRLAASSIFVDARYDLGGIARTTQRVTLPTIYGSLTINGASPRIALSGTVGSLYVGDVLEKVGRTTGWTAGTVRSTTGAVSDEQGTRLDNITVDAGVGIGDSGAPVFFRSSTGACYLAGILWGALVNQADGVSGTRFYVSKWANVDYELGTAGPDLIIVPPSSGGGGGGGGGGCTGPECPPDPL